MPTRPDGTLPQMFRTGDAVERVLSAHGAATAKWRYGLVVMVVPAGVLAYAMWRRWFSGKGICRINKNAGALKHREQYIVEVERGGKKSYYSPSPGTLRKVT